MALQSVQQQSKQPREKLRTHATKFRIRLVHDDRSRPRVQRNVGAKAHEVEMREWARAIRAFREEEGEGACAKDRPKLTLVYSSD